MDQFELFEPADSGDRRETEPGGRGSAAEGNRQAEARQPEAQRSDAQETGNRTAEAQRSGTRQAGSRASEAQHSGTRQAGSRSSEAQRPGTRQTGTRKAEAQHSGTRQAGNRTAEAQIELFAEDGTSRGFYSQKNRLNELTGKEWVYWSKSVINKPYPPNLQHKLRSRHGGQKPPELCADLIKVFTKQGQRVLDPFAGVGGTLLGASLCGRRALGIEINPQWVDLYRRVCQLEGLAPQELLCGDSKIELGELEQQGVIFDFILTDVPYWRMDRAERSRGKFKRVGEAQRERRSSKLSRFNARSCGDKEEWLSELGRIFGRAAGLLRRGSYLAVFIGDMYNQGQYHFLSADLARLLEGLELTLKANLIWYDVSKSLHVYGYRYQFIPSMIHQSILIFRKESG